MPEPPPRPERRPPTSWQESLRDVYPYLGLGMQIALSLVFFVGVGYLLDRWLGTMPWLLIAGALLGMVALFVQVVRVSNQLSRSSSSSTPSETEAEK